jgi:rare lipoprotein A
MAIAVIVIFGAAPGPASSWSPNYKAGAGVAVTFPVIRPKARPYQVGTASWYGDYFEGKPTASGEPYNMYDLTAAHPTLPLGTLVKVTNLRNHRVVVVRINDRGPIVPGRIIDVSYSAAKMLHFQSRGIQRVRLDVIPTRKPATTLALLREPALPQ